MSDFLIEAILLHRKVRFIHRRGFIYACRTEKCLFNNTTTITETNVSVYTLKELEDYLNN